MSDLVRRTQQVREQFHPEAISWPQVFQEPFRAKRTAASEDHPPKKLIRPRLLGEGRR